MAAQTDVVVQTGVVVSRDDAQTRADMIRSELDTLAGNIDNIASLVAEAWREKDHEALGYASWDDYVREQFSTHLLKLAKSVRQEWVATLKAAGMKTRQIAPVVNVSHVTVAGDVKELTSQASDPEAGVIDAEVVSDTRDVDEELERLARMIGRARRGIGYLAKLKALPEGVAPEQARAWYDEIAGKRGKGNAGLVTQLHDFAGMLSEALKEGQGK